MDFQIAQYSHNALVRLVNLSVEVISLLLKCSHCAFHMVCFRANWQLRTHTPNARRREKIQPVAVPLDTLPERRTITIHPEISARGSLIPAGDGSKLLSDTCPPGTRQWGRETSAPRPYETDPFPRELSSTLLLWLRFRPIYIWECSHCAFHMVHFAIWACVYSYFN